MGEGVLTLRRGLRSVSVSAVGSDCQEKSRTTSSASSSRKDRRSCNGCPRGLPYTAMLTPCPAREVFLGRRVPPSQRNWRSRVT